jgi:transposase
MKHLKGATEAILVTLSEAQKNCTKAHFRTRCLAIELSYRGKSPEYIADLIKIRRETVYIWLNRWESSGLAGLQIVRGRGLKAKLDSLLFEPQKESIDLIKKK